LIKLTIKHPDITHLRCQLAPVVITVSWNEILEVRLSRNQLSGPLPAWLASLPVILLDASHNKLSGSLPAAALGSNLVLQELLLAGNQFSGSLSADVLRCVLLWGRAQCQWAVEGFHTESSMHSAD
jgi:hypothetical protein